ncbi:unnamed protein product [Blepharisma stoltei]|uniref:Uncharacterized protein n=1 Tax=Blepharisma stoltei TaxID=1481888 RepID=A0AAU9K700_9CILI|nr:unnamed protein product [Blepharisma stoltei]
MINWIRVLLLDFLAPELSGGPWASAVCWLGVQRLSTKKWGNKIAYRLGIAASNEFYLYQQGFKNPEMNISARYAILKCTEPSLNPLSGLDFSSRKGGLRIWKGKSSKV